MSENCNSFPTDKAEYYYRCRISDLEFVKKKYDSYNNWLIKNNDVILKESSKEERDEIKKKLKKLISDFDKYADIIINKENINSEEDYKRYMADIMLIANETIVFSYESYGKSRKQMKMSFDLYNKKYKVKDILSLNRNIPFLLDMDDPVNNIIDRFQEPILLISFLLLMIMTCVVIIPILNVIMNKMNYPLNNDAISLLVAIFLVIAVILWLFFINSYNMKRVKIKNNAYNKVKGMVYHPYSSKFSVKSLFEAVDKIFSWISQLKK